MILRRRIGDCFRAIANLIDPPRPIIQWIKVSDHLVDPRDRVPAPGSLPKLPQSIFNMERKQR
jgi:hypothetical protein